MLPQLTGVWPEVQHAYEATVSTVAAVLHVIQAGIRCQDAVLSPSCRQAHDVGRIQQLY